VTTPFSLPLEEPIWEYSHSVGHSITGGYVYRGRGLGSAFVGRYFVADFVNSRVWSLQWSIDPTSRRPTAVSATEHTSELGAAAVSPASFGIDADGELYIVSLAGSIYRIEGPPGQVPAPPPASTPGFDGPRRRIGPALGHAGPR